MVMVLLRVIIMRQTRCLPRVRRWVRHRRLEGVIRRGQSRMLRGMRGRNYLRGCGSAIEFLNSRPGTPSAMPAHHPHASPPRSAPHRFVSSAAPESRSARRSRLLSRTSRLSTTTRRRVKGRRVVGVLRVTIIMVILYINDGTPRRKPELPVRSYARSYSVVIGASLPAHHQPASPVTVQI